VAVIQIDSQTTSRRRGIGPLGTTARVLVGGLLLGSVTWGHLTRGFHLSAWLLGLVGFPALLVAGQWLRARRAPTPLRATGPVGHVLNLAVFLALYLLEATSDATLIFYGASMLLAALRGYAGCEVLAVSNWLLRRDDQVGCALFWPIDQRERRRAVHAKETTTMDPTVSRPVIEVLYVQDCPNYQGALALVERVRAELGIDAELRTILIVDQAAAERTRFPGSPTVRVDGRDVEPGSQPPSEISVACRLYRLEHRLAGQPAERWVREALLRAAGQSTGGASSQPASSSSMSTPNRCGSRDARHSDLLAGGCINAVTARRDESVFSTKRSLRRRRAVLGWPPRLGPLASPNGPGQPMRF
jgi:hypothetical protein